MTTTYTWHETLGRFSLTMTLDQVTSVSHQGPCDDDVEALARELEDQLSSISATTKQDALAEYGAWDEDELTDEQSNNLRLVWIAGNDIADNPDDHLDDQVMPIYN